MQIALERLTSMPTALEDGLDQICLCKSICYEYVIRGNFQFKKCDKDGNGCLSWDEFCGALRSAGLTPSPRDIRALVCMLDCIFM